MDYIGPWKLKSKPSFKSIYDSRSIKLFFVTYYFSSSVRRPIILEKLGEIGCSSLADMRTLMVARLIISDLLKFWGPMALMYLSKILAAMKSVSIL